MTPDVLALISLASCFAAAGVGCLLMHCRNLRAEADIHRAMYRETYELLVERNAECRRYAEQLGIDDEREWTC